MPSRSEILQEIGWLQKEAEVEGVRQVSEHIYEVTENTKELREMAGQENEVIVIDTGVSGGGKDALRKELRKHGYVKVKTCTSAPFDPRYLEDGEDTYLRRTKEEFEEQKDDFVEQAPYAGYLYGTYRPEVVKALAQGKAVFVINPEGAETFLEMQRKGEEEVFEGRMMIYFFILPENHQQLARRLLMRDYYNGDKKLSEEERRAKVRKRWTQNTLDLEHLPKVHFVVVNETGRVEDVVEEMLTLIESLGK